MYNNESYFNYYDLNVIEQRILTFTNKLIQLGISIPVFYSHNWLAKEPIGIYELQRIEDGINNLAKYYYKPTGFIEPKLWDTGETLIVKAFGVADVNRWVTNLTLMENPLKYAFKQIPSSPFLTVNLDIENGKFTMEGGAEKNYRLISSGTQYIDTEFVPDNQTSVEIIIKNNITAFCEILGSFRKIGTFTEEDFKITRLSIPYLGFAKSDSNPSFSIPTGDYLKLKMEYISDESYRVLINGIEMGVYTFSSFTGVYPIYIFNVNASGNVAIANNGSLEVIRCKIWKNNILMREFIPVPQNDKTYSNTSAPSNCMWDTITQKYYTNKGLGTFAIVEDSTAIPLPTTTVGPQLINTFYSTLEQNRNYTLYLKGKKVSGYSNLKVVVTGVNNQGNEQILNSKTIGDVLVNNEYLVDLPFNTGVYNNIYISLYNAIETIVPLPQKTEYYDIKID